MTKHHIIVGVVVLSLLAGGIFGCQAAPTEEKSITLGVIAPMSGAAASWGLTAVAGWQVATDEINAAGGIKVGGEAYQVNLRTFDNKMDPAEARAAAAKLIEAYDCTAMYPGGSGSTLAIQPISEPAKVFLFTTAWTDNQFGPDKKYTYRISTGAYEPVSALYKVIAETTPGATVALTNPSNESGIASELQVKDFCNEYGLNLVFSDFYSSGTTDFTPLLTKIVSLNPTYYDIGVGTGDAPLLVKQAYELGYRGRMISIGDVLPDDVLEVAGKEAPFALHFCFQNLPWHSPNATPEQRELRDRFISETGTFNKLGVGAYISVMIYKEAAEAVDSFDPDKIAAYLETHSFDTVMGTLGFPEEASVRYGINHQLDQPAIFCEFTDNQGTWDLWYSVKPVWRAKK